MVYRFQLHFVDMKRWYAAMKENAEEYDHSIPFIPFILDTWTGAQFFAPTTLNATNQNSWLYHKAKELND